MPRRTQVADDPAHRRATFHNKRRALSTSNREAAYAEWEALRAAVAKLQPDSAKNAAWKELEDALAGIRRRFETRGQR